jgi:hypothetical protein
MTRSWLAALLLLTASGTAASAQELQWQPVPPLPALPENNAANTVVAKPLLWEPVPAATEPPTSTLTLTSTTTPPPPTTLVWESVTPSDSTPSDSTPSSTSIAVTPEASPTISANAGLVWEPVDSESVIVAEENPQMVIQNATEAIQIARRAFDEASPTYSSSRALWRNERWLPQISYLVPNGYGPYGVMFDVSVTGTDCTLGKGPCEPFTTFNEWQNSLDTQANGEVYFNAGIGNASSWGGILITNSLERIPAAAKSGSSIGNPLQGVQTGLHYAKAFGPDTSFRTGVENLITWDSEDYTYADMTRNFYLVGSQRIRLKSPDNNSKWFRNAYLTAGIGNGEFKPIEQTFKDQTEALKNAGCATYGYTPKNPCSNERFKRALRTGSDYGQINPIAAISVEVIDGFHLISEWTGRNLNAGFSWRPFESFGLVITPMINSIVQNCEYPGCRVTPIHGYPERVPLPDAVLTERVRLSLQASLQIKF